jgi:Cytochrome oxidase complex assembly protein 1/zinc-ribbon domain
MFCHVCGRPLEPSASSCPNCGAAIALPPAPPGHGEPKQKSPALKYILIGCGVLILLGAGAVVAVFFGVKYAFRTSDAARAAVQALRQSNNARHALGEITDVGTPMGSISSEAGGSGSASLSTSVSGSQASGKYYATLQRKDGQWFLVSGRIELADGRSINLETQASGRTVDVPRARGLVLNDAATDTSLWRNVEWEQQHVSLRLPIDWVRIKIDQRELEFRAGDMYSSTYLIGNAWIWERDLPVDNLLAADIQTASENFRNGVIAGYSLREVGGVSGVITISNVGGRRTATWKALVPADGAQKSMDISLGAQRSDFDRLAPMFNAIFNSIRFE